MAADEEARILEGGGLDIVGAYQSVELAVASLPTEFIDWELRNRSAIGTGSSIGICTIASAGICGLVTGAAFVVRSEATLEAEDGLNGRAAGKIGLDAGLTAVGWGLFSSVGAAATEGMTVTGSWYTRGSVTGTRFAIAAIESLVASAQRQIAP